MLRDTLSCPRTLLPTEVVLYHLHVILCINLSNWICLFSWWVTSVLCFQSGPVKTFWMTFFFSFCFTVNSFRWSERSVMSSTQGKFHNLTAMWHFCQFKPKGSLRVNSPQEEPHKESELPQDRVKTQISHGGCKDSMLQPIHSQEGGWHSKPCFISLKYTECLHSQKQKASAMLFSVTVVVFLCMTFTALTSSFTWLGQLAYLWTMKLLLQQRIKSHSRRDNKFRKC